MTIINNELKHQKKLTETFETSGLTKTQYLERERKRRRKKKKKAKKLKIRLEREALEAARKSSILSQITKSSKNAGLPVSTESTTSEIEPISLIKYTMLSTEEKRKIKSRDQAKQNNVRLFIAYENAANTDPTFTTKFGPHSEILTSKNYGVAARQLQVNWFDGTTNKKVDALYIIGKKDLEGSIKNQTPMNMMRSKACRVTHQNNCTRLLIKLKNQKLLKKEASVHERKM